MEVTGNRVSVAGPHQGQPVKLAGAQLREASAAIIMLHGRGADAQDILSVADVLDTSKVTFVAPEAAGNTWYPYSFLADIEQNEPYLSSALELIDEQMRMLQANRIPAERTMLLGFSQGACLAVEYAARHAKRYGGIAGLSGGLIGPDETPREYAGSFDGTPVFLGCSDHDPHIPPQRVIETEAVLKRMGAEVTRKLYPKMGHTISREEIAEVQKMVGRLEMRA